VFTFRANQGGVKIGVDPLNNYMYQFISDKVSGNDVDRLDYLLRDSKAANVSGQLETRMSFE
jgi:HD superfamily phosphohydrolase